MAERHNTNPPRLAVLRQSKKAKLGMKVHYRASENQWQWTHRCAWLRVAGPSLGLGCELHDDTYKCVSVGCVRYASDSDELSERAHGGWSPLSKIEG